MAEDLDQLYSAAISRHQAGEFDFAIALYRQFLARQPDDAEAFNNLGVALIQSGRMVEAADAFLGALRVRPNYAEAHNNLGNVRLESGNLSEAIEHYRAALNIEPAYADALENVAKALYRVRRFPESADAFSRLLKVRPGDAEAMNNLGVSLRASGRLAEAMTMFRTVATMSPAYADAHYNLATECLTLGRIDEAINAFNKSIAADPSRPLAHLNLGNALREQGRGDESLVAYRAAIDAGPGNPQFHSNLLYALWFSSSQSVEQIVEEHRRWARQFTPTRGQSVLAPPRISSTEKLRVGFVSPDLREQVVGIFIEPLLAGLDRARFEVICYSDATKTDTITAQLKSHASLWRETSNLNTAQLAKLIADDRIDILIDLTLHMANNRMPVFARMPAPVQATYLAYVGTSGMAQMDFRLSDPFFDPPDERDVIGVEKVERLPVYWSYVPPIGAADVNESPAERNGAVTFVCLNHLGKVSPEAVALWAKILHELPDSRLLIYAAGGGEHNSGPRTLFAAHGIGPERLRVVTGAGRAPFVANYLGADIALDPFPCAGGVTTMDALWMGVPVVTLPGPSPVSRAGRCILSHVGLTELIARSSDEYVEIALSLATDRPRLAELRRTLRAKMQSSPLMDRDLFVHGFEDALIRMGRHA